MRVNNVYIKKLKAPVYSTSLWIVVSNSLIKSIDTIEDMINYVVAHPKDKKSLSAYTYGYQDHDGKMRVIVFVTRRAKPGVIAHESNHAKNIILGWNGVKPSFTNDESESGYLEFIVQQVHNAIKMS